MLLNHGQIDRGLSRSHSLISGAQAARVLSAEAQVAGELRGRLGSLLDLLDECIADRDFWRSLSQADVYLDSYAARGLIGVGSAPWEELLHSGGYVSPPPPSADQLAAAISMNVRHAIESNPAELGRSYSSFVLNVRDRLKLHLRILRDRLQLSGTPRGASELPFVAKVTTDAAIDTAAALALPAIAADTVGSAGLGIVASMLSAVADRTWGAFEEYRDLRRPLSRRREHDPILQLLALMMDTVQEMRVNASLELPDPGWAQALSDRLERQSSWMRKMAAPPDGDFPQWRHIDEFSYNVRHGGDEPDAHLLTQLLRHLEDAFAARVY
ncbi:hypothetical protein ASD56_08945 [Microbacterium sp. Root166]|uniref:hypothetical protein n=1 Tax=Microbacterium sp. Root166 TaxID=1736478 RepID=UPI0006F90E38|nr:hypothetical protein [Microbacterium sp. Root166]KQZ84130.1 hypothetical protein ASD56_08945 [Microbacterium sp. Root166]